MAQERRTHDERRGEIADAALHIIGTRGITALTVTTLAKEIGVTGGALYRHFPSTDAILEAVAARAVELLDATLPDPSLSPLAWLERFVETRSRAVSGGLARLIFSEQVAMAMPKRATALLRGAMKTTFAAIERTLREGQAQGVIRSDISAGDLVPIVVGTVQLLAFARSGEPISRMVDAARVWRTLETILTVPGGSKS